MDTVSTFDAELPASALGNTERGHRVARAFIARYESQGYFFAGMKDEGRKLVFSDNPADAADLPSLRVNIKRLSELAVIPEYASAGAAGLDLVATETHTIEVGKTSIVGTGIAVELPTGYAAFVLPRSGLAAKSAITVVNAPGLIDSDYRGEIKVILTKLNRDGDLGHHRIDAGTRIAQLVILPYPSIAFNEVGTLDETERGVGGFGSTGVSVS